MILELGLWLVLTIILLASVVYLYGTWTYNYWKKKGIPYVEPVPLVGNLFDAILSRRALNDIYKEMYKWKITRSQLTPAFTSGKLKPLFPLIMEVCEELKDYLENYKHSGDGLEVKELAATYTTNVVASCVFGIRGDAIHNPKSQIREVGRAIIQPGFFRNIVTNLIILFPALAKMLKLRISSDVVDKFFERVTREVVEHREKNNITRSDFMQQLINIKQKFAALNKEKSFDPKEFAPEKNRFTNVDIMAQAVTFFTDGFETSSIALSYCLYDLALHPDVQRKLYLEVEDTIKKHDGQLTFDAVHGMTYLDMVLSESLRLHPPVAMMMKQCTKPFDLEMPSGGTYTVEVGTPVHIPIEALHHDPKYYPNPELYDPERFSDENKNGINKYTYLPFGGGPRLCLGFRFGQTQVKAGIAYLVHHFEIRPTIKTPKVIVFDPSYFLPVAKGGLYLDFVKRKNTATS